LRTRRARFASALRSAPARVCYERAPHARS